VFRAGLTVGLAANGPAVVGVAALHTTAARYRQQSITMAAVSAVQCNFLAGAQRIAARKTVRARAAVAVRAQAKQEQRQVFQALSKVELPAAVRPAVAGAVANVMLAMPALAKEPGALFDFNLTLPIIAGEFLLLLVILDKTIFGPVGKALDDRDELIRSQLAAVGDNSSEVDSLISEKEKIISDARAVVAKEVAETKAKMDADIAAASEKAKADVDAQIAKALKTLESAKEESNKQVEIQAAQIADQIVAKVVEV